MIIGQPHIKPMGSIVSSCVVDLDATIVDSYTSGETWSNIEPNPGDGTSQTANDFYMGATGTVDGDEPTFTGTAGDPGAYMLYDGGDQNNFKGTITSFFDDIHKTTGGADWTVFIPFYFVGGTTQVLFGNRSAGGTTIGLIIWTIGLNDKARLTQRGNTANSSTNSSADINDSAVNIVGVSHSHSANNTRYWVNTSTAQNVSQTFNTTTTAASGVPCVGAYSGGSAQVINGQRYYGISCFNEYFDDEKARAVIDQYNARHNRVYA